MKIKTLPVLVAASLSAMAFGISANDNLSMTIQNQANNGSPSFVTGNLGSMTQKTAKSALKNILASQSDYGFTGKEDFQIQRQWFDELGKSHTHFSQTINGLKVYGTSLILHANVTGGSSLTSSGSSSEVYALTGALAVDTTPSNSLSMLANHDNGNQAKAAALSIGDVNSTPELSYVYVGLTGETKLAWRVNISWDNGPGDFGNDIVFYDAFSNELLVRDPQVHSAKSWKTYTLNGGSANSAPGQLLCTNNQSCGSNAAAQRAHDGASKVYDYYYNKHNRDSLDNNGMAMISSVDLGEANAYWTGTQMLYGSGGSFDNDLTSDFDVIAHEFTHGVTDKTANLVYQNASGALNEAWSDIFGVTAEAYRNGTNSPAWLLGDDLYNQAGKALRYMNNPTNDNYSKDYYPERIPFTNNPTRQNDYGGVHGNSGIANLAYVLLVDGGKHPRNKTNVQVPGIGMAKAEKIFYRALVTYMNQNTSFSGARTATASAAQDLYGATEKNAVETAWCAVGVGTCPSTDPDPDPTPGNELQNGVAKTGLSASTGNELKYTFNVPAGATNIKFEMSGGTGDADLYVKLGSVATDNNWDCRPYKNGNTESCTGSQAGTYHVRLKAYSTFSGVSIKASYTGDTNPDPTTDPINETLNNVSVNRGQWTRYTQVLPAGYSSMTITISGGSGDADLYVRKGAQSTLSAYDCRPYKNGNNESCTFNNPGADTWYIDLYGYSAASGITLNLKANP